MTALLTERSGEPACHRDMHVTGQFPWLWLDGIKLTSLLSQENSEHGCD